MMSMMNMNPKPEPTIEVYKHTLNQLWYAEDTCRVGSDIRIAHDGVYYIIIERRLNFLGQHELGYNTFKAALAATQGMTLKGVDKYDAPS